MSSDNEWAFLTQHEQIAAVMISQEEALLRCQAEERSLAQGSPAVNLPPRSPSPNSQPPVRKFTNDELEPKSGQYISFARRPRSVALERYLSSDEDYLSLQPGLNVNTQPDINIMASPTPQEPSFHGVVGRSAKPEVVETASAPNPSVMPLFTSASPAPQLAHNASVPQPVQDPPYNAAQPASPSFSPDPYFIYQQNPGRQKSRPSAQHVPVARHVLENIPSDSPRHVVHQTPPSRVIFSTQSAPSEPRAMRSAAQIQAPTSSQARITKVNHQQEPVASISEKTPFQAHNMQAHVQGAAVAKEASSKSQRKEIHEEQAENVSSQSQHTHTRNQRASTMQTPPQLRHAAILRESVHTRNRSLYSVVPQYHTSPLHREVPQSDPDIRLTAFEGHRGPTTAGFQNLPIYGQPAFVNRQLFASPFQGQAEATSANVRTGNFVGKPLIIDSNDETVPSQGPTTASSNLFHNPLSDGQQGSEFTASQTSTIQNQGQSVHSATIVHGSDIRGQLLSDRDHNPQVQAGTPSAEVGISAVRDVDRTFPYGYAPASDSIEFYNAWVRGNPGTELSNPHAPPFHDPAYPNVHATPVRGNQTTGFGNQYVSPSHGQSAGPGYPNIHKTPVRGNQATGHENPYTSPSHGQAAAAHPSMFTSPVRVAQAIGFGMPHTPNSQNQGATSYPNVHDSPVRGDQATGFGNLHASPPHSQSATGYQNIHFRRDQRTGYGNPYAPPFQSQPVTTPANFHAYGYPGAEVEDPYNSPLQRQQGTSSANIHTNGYPGTDFTNPHNAPFQGRPVNAAPNFHESPAQVNVEPGFARLQVSPTRALDPRSPSFHVPPNVGTQENCYHWMTYRKCSAGYGPCPYAHPIEKAVDVPDLKGPTHYESGHTELDNMERKAEQPLTVGPKAMSQPYELYAQIIVLVSESKKLQTLVKPPPSKDKKAGDKPVSVADSLKRIKEKIQDYVEQFNVYGVVITKRLPKLLEFGPVLSLAQERLKETELQSQQIEIIDRCGKEVFEVIKRQREAAKAGSRV